MLPTLLTGCSNAINSISTTNDVLDYLKGASKAKPEEKIEINADDLSADMEKSSGLVKIVLNGNNYLTPKISSISKLSNISNPKSIYLYSENLTVEMKGKGTKIISALCFINHMTTCLPLFHE